MLGSFFSSSKFEILLHYWIPLDTACIHTKYKTNLSLCYIKYLYHLSHFNHGRKIEIALNRALEYYLKLPG